jgi:hypothetical protein
MSMQLSLSLPKITLKTPGVVVDEKRPEDEVVFVEIAGVTAEVPMSDFLMGVEYVLANTDLRGDGDPRWAFLKKLRNPNIVSLGWSGSGARLRL